MSDYTSAGLLARADEVPAEKIDRLPKQEPVNYDALTLLDGDPNFDPPCEDSIAAPSAVKPEWDCRVEYEECFSCKFFEEFDEDKSGHVRGLCKKRSPDTRKEPPFPLVRPHDFCGQWKAMDPCGQRDCTSCSGSKVKAKAPVDGLGFEVLDDLPVPARPAASPARKSAAPPKPAKTSDAHHPVRIAYDAAALAIGSAIVPDTNVIEAFKARLPVTETARAKTNAWQYAKQKLAAVGLEIVEVDGGKVVRLRAS